MCKNCQAGLTNKYSIYCSTTCQQAFQREQKIAKWLAGDWNPVDKRGMVQSVIRNYLLAEAGYKCTECGWGAINPTTGKVPLQIDHINGNANDCSPANLRVLCPNCHSLTPTYGALNKGSGRAGRYASLVQW